MTGKPLGVGKSIGPQSFYEVQAGADREWAPRVLPRAWWDRRRHVWVVPLSGPAAVALVQFAHIYGFEMTAAVQVAIDNTGDIKAPGRRDEGRRAR